MYAQAAAYAHEQPYAHQRALEQDLGHTAAQLAAGEAIVTEDRNMFNNELRGTAEHGPEQYVNFLRNADPATRANIRFLANKMAEFDDFREPVAAILKDASIGDDHYLGRGSNGKAFRLTHDGVDYAVKTGGVSFLNVPAFREGDHIEGISHLIAIDIDNEVSVMNLVPGTIPEKMAQEEKLAIPDEHIDAVIDKVIEMHDAGLHIDPKPSNFLYDKDKGFGIIDYHSASSRNAADLSVATQVMGARTMLVYTNIGEMPKYGTPGYEQSRHEHLRFTVAMYNRFLDRLEANHPELLEQARVEQQAANANPKTTSSGILDIYTLPAGEPFDSFKDRVLKLGLEGDPPHVSTYDDDFEYDDDSNLVG